MKLKDFLKSIGIDKYSLFWYGRSYVKSNFKNNRLKKMSGEFRLCQIIEGCTYLILEGLGNKKVILRGVYSLKPISNEMKDKKNIECSFKEINNSPLNKYIDRLVLEAPEEGCKHTFIAKNVDFEIIEIKPASLNEIPPFQTYDRLELDYNQLRIIIENRCDDYYKPLSIVKGIYMIIDKGTGRQYIGSAYGDEGIYGRWANYAVTYHGNNKELIKLTGDDMKNLGYIVENFKYIILEILPYNMSTNDIIERENYYKKRFMTREFGYNDN